MILNFWNIKKYECRLLPLIYWMKRQLMSQVKYMAIFSELLVGKKRKLRKRCLSGPNTTKAGIMKAPIFECTFPNSNTPRPKPPLFKPPICWLFKKQEHNKVQNPNKKRSQNPSFWKMWEWVSISVIKYWTNHYHHYV